jgi:hypothetical protein
MHRKLLVGRKRKLFKSNYLRIRLTTQESAALTEGALSAGGTAVALAGCNLARSNSRSASGLESVSTQFKTNTITGGIIKFVFHSRKVLLVPAKIIRCRSMKPNGPLSLRDVRHMEIAGWKLGPALAFNNQLNSRGAMKIIPLKLRYLIAAALLGSLALGSVFVSAADMSAPSTRPSPDWLCMKSSLATFPRKEI